jgi:hypothetical protein
MEDERYCSQMFMESKDCLDCDECWDCQLIYNSNNLWYSAYKVWMSSQCLNELRDIWYCKTCFFCSNCFGCIGLKRKQYCILNKQYTKEDYELLVPQIIEHMRSWATSGWQRGSWATSGWHEGSQWQSERWEFFPIEHSLVPYNLSMAQEWYPLTKAEAEEQWFRRKEKEIPINVSDDLPRISSRDIPDTIKEVDDDILNKAIICQASGKLYKITVSELAFYRKHDIPLPVKHFEVRHAQRCAQRMPRQLYLRICDRCRQKMLSIYPQRYEGKVYCEACYNRGIYG